MLQPIPGAMCGVSSTSSMSNSGAIIQRSGTAIIHFDRLMYITKKRQFFILIQCYFQKTKTYINNCPSLYANDTSCSIKKKKEAHLSRNRLS